MLDKPSGFTSNEALQQVKRLYFAKKAGHTGSLDPFASGVLPICLGEATKVSAFLLDADKRYQVRCQLGVRTATADAEGEVLETRPVVHYSREQLEQVLNDFRGSIEQIPPMYSALKHQGQRLYKLARQGVEVERQPRPVEIYELTWQDRAKTGSISACIAPREPMSAHLLRISVKNSAVVHMYLYSDALPSGPMATISWWPGDASRA